MKNTQNYEEVSIRLCGNFAENFFVNFDTQKDQFKPAELFSSVSFEMIQKRNALTVRIVPSTGFTTAP